MDPAGRIVTRRVARGVHTHRRLLARAKRLLRGAGYDAILTQHFDIAMNSHQCETVLAGAARAASVLDPWCRSHDVENLWVIDAGFFPSSAAMNPALTIAPRRCGWSPSQAWGGAISPEPRAIKVVGTITCSEGRSSPSMRANSRLAAA